MEDGNWTHRAAARDCIPSDKPPGLSYVGMSACLGTVQNPTAEMVAASILSLYKNLSARHRVRLTLQWVFQCLKITTCLLS